MIHPANQIACSLPSSSARPGSFENVLDHFKKFWERRMRDQIIAYVAKDGKGLHELALEAVKWLQ